VTVITSAQTTQVLGNGEKVTGSVYKDRVSGNEVTVELEGIFVQIGLVPNTEWLKGDLALSNRGEIEVDAQMQPTCPVCLPLATARRCPTSRSSSPWAKAPRPAFRPFDYLIRN
jgi:alkyl hydroperoxide reductase subunit F